jgi:1-aminocyclopropane-1-carboxylate deaminase/D-cysteine desulfhydrase-like pyridoxal-dependent ACC family enzyme
MVVYRTHPLYSMMIVPLLKVATASTASLAISAVLLLRRISDSVGLAPPTSSMLEEENPVINCPLFRHLPNLANAIAWRSLGAVKTPVHTCRVPFLDQTKTKEDTTSYLEFLVKREDLISPIYGGNKVRTLQHQLAICESRRERGEKSFRQLVSCGTGGSNQVLATVVHARSLGWDGIGSTAGGETKEEDAPRVNVLWFDKDEPDLDNTLNMLSVLSFPNVGFKFDWGDSVGGVANLFRTIWGTWTQRNYVPMMPGGNCPSGVLGQVSGVLELAEQICSGESPDPSRIYVPVGSGCTISGLILGTVLVRHLGMSALSDLRIVGCNVHEGVAKLDRMVKLHVHPGFGFMPLTITHTVKEACRALKEIGGPDLEVDALDFIKTSVDIRADEDVVGIYGGHSGKTRAAAKLYDEKGVMMDSVGQEAEKLWLCGHFASKAFQPLLKDLEEEANDSNDGKAQKFMLWMTKSAVQPRGNVDEWNKLLQENDTVKQWANEGKAESSLRPGRVSTQDGKPEDYRLVMTKVL